MLLYAMNESIFHINLFFVFVAIFNILYCFLCGALKKDKAFCFSSLHWHAYMCGFSRNIDSLNSIKHNINSMLQMLELYARAPFVLLQFFLLVRFVVSYIKLKVNFGEHNKKKCTDETVQKI